MSKRFKLQTDVRRFFSTSVKEKKRLICKGSVHQGEFVNGGSQCVCVSLVFVCLDGYPRTQAEVDKIVAEGTEVFHMVSEENVCLLISEIPEFLEISGQIFQVKYYESRSGLISQTSDEPGSMYFCMSSSLRLCFEESNNVFLTIGGSTTGIKRVVRPDGTTYYVLFDSHSRDDSGMCSPHGTSVVFEILTQDDLADHITHLAASMNSQDTQFELTAVVTKTCAHPGGDDLAKRSRPSDVTATRPIISHSPTRQHPNDGPVTRPQPSSDCLNTQQSNEGPVTITQTSSDSSTSISSDMHAIQRQDISMHDIDNQLIDNPQQIDVDSQQSVPPLDIKNYDSSLFSDDLKFQLITEREPENSFIFPPKLYKDKRSKTGQMKRHCNRDWFKTFPFISYSKEEDGLYCLACVIFPDTSHRRSKWFILQPFSNWKHAIEDLKAHSISTYHLNSMEKLESFKTTYTTPSRRIDVTLNTEGLQKLTRNRQILASILKTLVFCGRRGIALRSHRDDDTSSAASLNMGNFKELLQFRVDAGDKVLQEHLSSCAKNASYTSKTSQNELLYCVKTFIQQTIVDEVKSQAIGPLFGFQCDEVTDNSNWEQLGIVLRYTTPHSKAVERLLEFVPCEEITGAALSDKILETFQEVGLDPSMCRSQTMDGAGNMAGKTKGCAARIRERYHRAVYHYCSSHDLNLALSKSCQVKEVHIMLDSLKQLGLFFKYSPKRSRRLESAIDEVNKTRPEQIKKSKFKLFCETRWVEKHTCLNDFDEMYEALLICLEAIASLEAGWDAKAVVDANGLLKRITDSTFIVCFQTVHQYFGYFSGISRKLQGSTLDIIHAYTMIEDIRSMVAELRNDDKEYDNVFAKAMQMASAANIPSLEPPRRCGRQTQRSNVPSSTPKEFFHRSIYLPFVDALLSQVNMRFSSLSKQAVQALTLIPKNHHLLTEESCEAILEYFREDLPSPANFHQEVRLWQRLWSNKNIKPDTLDTTLADESVCKLMFSNIYTILHILMLTSVTSSSVERGNSSLKFIKNKLRSTMGGDRLNALVLMYIHKDIHIDIDAVITMYARRNPRKMLLQNPLSD